MKKLVFIIIVVLTLCLPRSDVYAQLNNFNSYSIEEGLSQSSVYTLLQDSKGYIWIGTDGGGVNRFDGVKFKHLGKKDGLAGDVVRSVMEDAKGNIWFGTLEGISFYDGVNFSTIDTSDGLKSNVILRIFESSNGNVYVGMADGGLAVIKRTGKNFTVQSITNEQGLSSNFVFDILEDKKGRIWLATWEGGVNILSFSGDSITDVQLLKANRDIPTNTIVSAEVDKDGNFWFGTYNSGVFQIVDPAGAMKVVPMNSAAGLTGKTVWDIRCDRAGRIWFGTNESGVTCMDHGIVSNYSEKEGFTNNQVMSILTDEHDDVWFGTFGSGIWKLNGFHFSHFSEREGLPEGAIYAVNQTENGNLLIGGSKGSFSIMSAESGTVKQFQIGEPTFSNIISSIAVQDNGLIWIATGNGLVRFDGTYFTTLTEDDGLINNTVHTVITDSKGNIWAGTNGGLSKLDNVGFRSISESEGLIHNEVQVLMEDSKGFIWIGTWGGLARYGNGTLITYDEVEGLFDKRVYALEEDMNGDIWIGTFGGGLYKFDTRKDSLPIQFVIGDSLLSSNNIYSLQFIDDKTLIVGTDKGMDKLSFTSSMGLVTARNYSRSDGFKGVECNLNAVHHDPDDGIWIGTAKGITLFSPTKEAGSQAPPKLHLTGLKLFFESVDWSLYADSVTPWFRIPVNLVLPYQKNHLTFQFAGLSMDNPGKVSYRYMMEGVDSDWSPSLPDNEVVYSALPPGDYVFKVLARNAEGQWTAEPLTFRFTITPPFWKTWWFIALVSLSVLGGIYLYIKYREQKLKKEKEILEGIVKDRTREIVNQKEEIEHKNLNLERANEEITHQKEVIEEKNRDILDSINYAKRIQDTILPPDQLVKQYFPDSFILFKPKDIVSGDFYWMDHKEELSLLAAIDCTGHGVPGAFVSIVGNNGLKRSVNEFGLRKPAEILDKLSSLVEETFAGNDQNHQLKDGMDVCMISLDRKNQKLYHASANNPLYVIRAKSEGPLLVNGTPYKSNLETEMHYLYQVEADSQPIGSFENRKNFTANEIDWKSGDVFYLFTDGFADQFGGPKGKKFKYKAFKELLLSIQHTPINAQKSFLDKTITEWMGELSQIDDICIIGVKIS